MQARQDFVRVLVRHKAKCEFRRRTRRDHRLRSRSGITAEDAVDFDGGPRPKLLEEAAVNLPGGTLQANRAEKGLFIEAEISPLRDLRLGRLDDIVIKSRDKNVSALVPHAGEELGQHADRVARRTAIK